MAIDQYYEKVAAGEDDSLMNGGKSKVVRAPPTQKRGLLTNLGIGAIVLTIFIAAVALCSSAVIAYRLPAATQAALEKAQSQFPPTSVVPVSPSATPAAHNDDHVDDVVSDEITTTTPYPDPNAEITHLTSNFTWKSHQEMRSCGHTPDEARAAGCVFDVMMQLWTPPECMDSPLSERYLETGNWTWYANSDASKIYDDQEIRLGNHDVVYVAQSYHRHHCIFAWERVVRAMRTQSPLIEELISYDHVMHCRHKTLTLPSEGAESVRGVVAPTGYTKCASYDVWINNLPFNKMSSTD